METRMLLIPKSSESASLAEEMHQVYDRLARRFTAFSRKTEYISYFTYLDFIRGRTAINPTHFKMNKEPLS